MAQETKAPETAPVDFRAPQKAVRPANGAVLGEVVISRQTVQPNSQNTGDDAQEDSLWERAIANSFEAIRELADKALDDRRAGRTKKITL